LGDKIPKAHIFRTDQKPLMADSNAIHAPSIQAIWTDPIPRSDRRRWQLICHHNWTWPGDLGQRFAIVESIKGPNHYETQWFGSRLGQIKSHGQSKYKRVPVIVSRTWNWVGIGFGFIFFYFEFWYQFSNSNCNSISISISITIYIQVQVRSLWGLWHGKVPSKPFTRTNFVNFYCDFLEPNDSQSLWPGKSRKSVGGHAPLKAQRAFQSNRNANYATPPNEVDRNRGKSGATRSALQLIFNDARFVHSGATNCLLWVPQTRTPSIFFHRAKATCRPRVFPSPNRIRCGQSALRRLLSFPGTFNHVFRGWTVEIQLVVTALLKLF